MSRLKLINHRECPPDQYRYKFPEDGYTVKCFTHDGWMERVKDHARFNGYPVPTVEDCEDQLCRLLPPGWCTYETGELPEWHIDARVGMEEFINGTRVLGTFTFAGMPTVSQELVESRTATCASCYFNIPIPGCGPCHALANLVVEVAGDIKTKADPMLRACAVCKCANEAQTRLPIEVLAKGVTEDMMPKWPPFCWKKQELLKLTRQEV